MTATQYSILMGDMDNAAVHIIRCVERKEKFGESDNVDMELSIIKSLRYHFELDMEKQQFSLTKLGITRWYHYTANYELRYGSVE